MDNIDVSALQKATPEELAAIETALLSELALASPADFSEFVDPKFERAPHIDLISNTMVDLIEDRLLKPNGKPYKKLKILMPPRHGKTTTATKRGIAWYLARYPDRHVMSLSYNEDYASTNGREIRQLLLDYGPNFGVEIAKDSKALTDWRTNQGGGLLSAGIYGSITGRPGDLIIMDDPIKGYEDAYSDIQREKLWNTYGSTILPRQEKNTKIILVYTHWHEDDLGGRLDLNEPGEWFELKLPALAEDNDLLGREIGEPLWPSHFDKEMLDHIRNTSIPWVWAAEYQQRPNIEGGGHFRRENFRYASLFRKGVHSYIRLHIDASTSKDFPVDKCWKFSTVDLAATVKTSSDYTVFSTYLVTPDWELIHIDQFRDRIESDQHEYYLEEYVFKRHNPRFVGVEDITFGKTLLQKLVRKGKRVESLKPDKDKVTRALNAVGYMAAGRIYFLKGAPWLQELESELELFDHGAHDDQVDTLAYAAKVLADREHNSRPSKREREPRTLEEKVWAQIKKNRKGRGMHPEFGAF